MRSTADPIAVIGAGVIGLAVACKIARQNENVVLIDRGEPGREASYGNAGHIATEQIFPLASLETLASAPAMLLRRDSPLSVRREYALQILPWLLRFAWASRPGSFRRGTAALSALQSRALTALATLLEDAGIASLLQQRGHMILVESEQSLSAVDAMRRRFDSHEIPSAWLTPDDVAARAPELKTDIAGALLLRDTAHVTNPYRVCAGLLEAFLAAGGRSVRAEVRAVAARTDGGFDIFVGDGDLRVAKVIVCAGAWSGPLAAQLGSPVPLDTERGYNVTAEQWHGEFDVSIASWERKTIMTPMDCGLRITGFVEFGGLSLPRRQRSLDRLKIHLQELFPQSDFPAMSEWIGFRPSLPDHLPIIGASPLHPGAFFAFGHQHLGLTLAGVTADVLAALIGDGEPPVDITPFRIDRF